MAWKVISEKSYLFDVSVNLHHSVCDWLSRVCRMQMIRYCNLRTRSHGLGGPPRTAFGYPEIVSLEPIVGDFSPIVVYLAFGISNLRRFFPKLLA